MIRDRKKLRSRWSVVHTVETEWGTVQQASYFKNKIVAKAAQWWKANVSSYYAVASARLVDQNAMA